MSLTSSPTSSAVADLRSGLLVLAAIALLAALTDPVGSWVTGIVAGTAVMLVVAASLVGVNPEADDLTTGPTAWFLGIAGVGFVVGATRQASDSSVPLGVLLAGLGGTFLWLMWRWKTVDRRQFRVLVALALLILSVVAVAAIVVPEKPLIDVILTNEAAADALARGENPYVTAITENTSPIVSSDAKFNGYAYPPVALVAYSISDWAFGDIRWANVLAIALFVVVIARPWLTARSNVPTMVIAAVFAAVLLPSLGFLLRYGWTEPIALPLLAGAVLTWRTRPITAAVLLGLALATKQYFILLAPLLLLWNDDFRLRRVAVAGGISVATMVPFIALDPMAFWDAVIAPSLQASVRPDSLNIVAIGIDPPPWLASAFAAAGGIVLGRRGGNGAAFAIAASAVFGLAFFFGFQAFLNYWYLIISLCLLALVGGLWPTEGGSPSLLEDESPAHGRIS